MKRPGKLLLLLGVGLCLGSSVWGQEKVLLRAKFPEGTAQYKHTYSFEYYGDRSELLGLTGVSGSLRVNIDGEWRSQEQAEAGEETDVPEDAVRVLATIAKADSRVVFGGQRLTYEQFPFTMDMLNDRQFSWYLMPDGVVSDFQPEFKPYTLSRQDMITDLQHLWMPEYYPVLPEEPVGVGETWTGERVFEARYANMGLQGRNALLKLSSTYKLKEIKEKKGRRVATVEEQRKFTYDGWVHVEVMSLLLAGEGKGHGEWVIDADLGIVVGHTIRMDIDQPEVTVVGEKQPVSGIRAEVKIIARRELDKLEMQ